MPWFLVILFLSLTFGNVSEATKHPSAAVVVGTVYCDTCFQRDFPMSSHFISGASVAVECKDGNSKPKFRKEAKTDEQGEFKVQLPFSVSKHVKRIKGCTVKLVSSSEPYCAVASAATSSSLRLKSRKQGEHVFSAGFFSFKPLKQPNLCNQKPRIENSKQVGSLKTAFSPNVDSTFPPPIQDPPTRDGFLPPLPQLPEIPPLPPLPKMQWPFPVPGRRVKNSIKPQFSDRKVARPDTFPLPSYPIPLPPGIPNPRLGPFQPPPLIPSPPGTPPLNPNPPPGPGLTPSPQTGLPPFPFWPPPGAPPAASSKNSAP
ncbi:formin-2-like [Neltuma alba]|uniref:formin-2-like n=1 Tax=Neltuma alba TaxID=207710 RepID=UPI0010A59404|nr:formin-2-like [Prosopis alba]XP_028782920.1 formin-2-like [Prosopis alba]